MPRLIGMLGVLVLTACGVEAVVPEPGARPMRIVSLDYCADQYVLKLVDRERILAVSPDAGYHSPEARGRAWEDDRDPVPSP